jgi:hypothetical protein
MNGPLSITLVLTTATHVACLTVALLSGPSNESFGVLFLAWLCVPSTVSAIGLAPRWQPIVTASINGLVTAVTVNTLLVGFSYFWPNQPQSTQIGLAVAYLLLFPGIAATCGAFITIIIRTIENAPSQPALVIGTKKGLSFAGMCAVLSLPVLLLLLPAQSSLLVVSLGYIVGALLLGTIVGAMTGCSYQPLRRYSQRTNAA